MIKRNPFRSELFDSGHLIRDLVADDLVKYIMSGGDVKNIRRFFLRHRDYAPKLFIYSAMTERLRIFRSSRQTLIFWICKYIL